jgi:hypothetical protein
MVASTWKLLDSRLALSTLCNCTALQLNPFFELLILHTLAATALVPLLAALEADSELTDLTLCLIRKQARFDNSTTVGLRTPSKILIQVHFDVFLEF